ncbi:MAG: endonuclease/exonuclease/phosphatase family protein [Candidatus Binatia bacterium]
MTSSSARSVFLLGLIVFVAALPLSADAADKPRPVEVMTRNLYLGADLTPAITEEDLPAAASAIWQQVQATNFPERAKALAAEIKQGAPLLIGLQEVALWRTGPPDGPPALGGTPATAVAYDFLALLLGALANGHSPYQAVVVQQEADLEAPTTLGFDVRLTMRDVILVRRVGEVTVDAHSSANFVNNLVLPTASGATVTSTRGWTAVDVMAKKRSFRFVNTHLEAFSNTFRSLQALELLAGPLATSLPIVLVGDLNSAPNDPDTTNPYDILTTLGGLADTWPALHPNDPGNTCCQDADLLNEESALVERLDYIMISDGDAYRSSLVGDQPADRTRGGLWPSDHAGVKADVAP